METLPEDIITENIFSHLPIESTLQCRRVCRTWRTIIGDSNVGLLFRVKKTKPTTDEDHVTQPPIYRKIDHEIQLYYGDHRHEFKIEKYYSENTLTPLVPVVESNGMVGSCNGLVCSKAIDPTYGKDGLAFVVSNPVTGEASFIPGLKKNWYSPVGGFGYVHLTNEYKVVRICSSAYVEVYTLGSRLGWRDKELGFDNRFLELKESGIFANGALHWINRTWSGQNPNPKMLAFGLADEKFSPVPAPPCLRTSKDCKTDSKSKLILLGGNLCIVHMNYERNDELYKKRIIPPTDGFTMFMYHNSHQYMNKRLDIWALKKTNAGTSCGEAKGKRKYYYDDTWSWSLDYSIEWEGGKDLYTPFVITKQNTVLLFQNGTGNIFCYDPHTSTLQKYSDGDERSVGVQAIPHMNSLVSLKELGEARKQEEADKKS